MYIPPLFRQANPEVLHQMMRQYSFATLITIKDGTPFVSHLPFLFVAEPDGQGLLLAHMARANSQWKDFASGTEVLTVFQGPHAYVSPSWYEGRLNVPTWNYVAVHAYGVPELVEDPGEFRALLASLVDIYESGFEKPWRFDLPDDYVRDMMKGIVGFRIRITRLEGKEKLSQNRDEADRRHVAEMLTSSPDPVANEVAAWMKRLYKRMSQSPSDRG
jgi:transcriptional regulator